MLLFLISLPFKGSPHRYIVIIYVEGFHSMSNNIQHPLFYISYLPSHLLRLTFFVFQYLYRFPHNAFNLARSSFSLGFSCGS